MQPLILTALAVSLGAGQTLSTDYSRDRALSVSVVSTQSSMIKSSEITLDGEPVEGRGGRGGFGGGAQSSERRYTFTDTVVTVKDGAPTKVKRAFGAVAGSVTMESRDGEQQRDLESAFAEAVIVIDATGDEVKYEVTEGNIEDEQLAGLVPTLSLDHLLPTGEVEAGAKWELTGADLLAAVGTDFERQLFRRAAPEGGAEGGARGGRGQGGRPTGGGLAMLASGEWDAEAHFTDETEEVDGIECAVIALTAEVSGELEERAFGGGRGRGGDRAASLEVVVAPRSSTYEAEIEGRLLWSVKEARAVRLHVTGKVLTSIDRENETQRGVMRTRVEQEANYEMTVDVTAGPKGD